MADQPAHLPCQPRRQHRSAHAACRWAGRTRISGTREALDAELERVFNICHGCRRCVSLCHAFPTLFDLIDESPTLEIDGVDKADYAKVTEHCYLCDLCYQTKCPYVPPHEWNVDFPHLMLRAKAVEFRNDGAPLNAPILSNTTAVGKLASIPVVVQTWSMPPTATADARKLLEKTLGVDPEARVPEYHTPTARKRLKQLDGRGQAHPAGRTTRQGRPVRHLLLRPLHAGRGRGPGRGVRAQRAFPWAGREGGLLRHAQVGTGRPGNRAQAEGEEHPGAGRDGRAKAGTSPPPYPPAC